MKKDAYYFSHDSNAKDDPKCVLLIEQLGLEGYGIFWVLIETLRDQPEYKYPLALLPAIARKYNTTTEKVKAVINGYGLFQVDELDFFSLAFIERMKVIDGKREQARQAVLTRWQKQKQLPPNNDSNTDVYTDVIQGKERKEKKSKGKESKVNNKTAYAEAVYLLIDEYEKLINQHGKEKVERMIDILNNYKLANGKKYESDYRAILNWVVDRVLKEWQEKPQPKKSNIKL